MAGLPWIKVWTVIPAHPKVQRLESVLGLKDALGIVVRLWCWTAKYAPDGDIVEHEIGSAGKAARGDASRQSIAAMIEALATVGFLDRTPTGYRVHDWHEMQTVHVEAEEKRRDQARDRQARLRARRNADPESDVTRDVTRDAIVTVTESNAGDKKEKRGEGEENTTRPCPSFSTVLPLASVSETRKLGVADA